MNILRTVGHMGARNPWFGRAGVLSACLFVACASPPPAPPPPVAATPSAPVTVVAPIEPPPVATPIEPPAATPAAPSPIAPADAPRAITTAMEFLQAGQEEQAENELKRVLLGDPNNRQAQSLIKQMKDDPVATLGRESFAYRVQPGESLSRIAQRFLGDVQQFYILARYNGIKVPRTLAEGQTIRVPGKAPPAAAATAAPSVAVPGTTPASPETPADSAASAERQKTEAIARHTRDARGAFAKQDLDGALRSWDAVLKLDPDNRTAFLEREKILGLKVKLGNLK